MALVEEQALKKNIGDISSQITLTHRLFSARSMKQFLFILYKESARRFQTQSLMCCWNSGHFGPWQQGYVKGGFYEKTPLQIWPESSQLKIGEPPVRQYMAHTLGRPVQNVLTLPLFIKKYMVSHPPPCLFVEFVMKHAPSIQSFYHHFLSFITHSIDRLLLEDHLQVGSDLLYSTFNKLQEPLAILDKTHHITSSNEVFNKIPAFKKKIYQKTCHWENKIYEQYRYPIYVRSSMYHVYHYVDMTESLSLRNHMIQNEKMSALGKLGETVAHELNNPLTGLLSMAQLMLDFNSLNKDLKQDMKDVAVAVLRSQNIIAHLLDFSKTSSLSPPKKEVLSFVYCDLNTAVQSTLALLKSMTSCVNCQVELGEGPILVKAELCLLQQVIFNLVKNACQALESVPHLKNKTVQISVKKTGNQAQVLVEDSGPGVTPKDYLNIFKPFFTTKQKSQGTGLGLNLSANIVHNFNGTLKVSLSPLGGACFALSLPVAHPPQPMKMG